MIRIGITGQAGFIGSHLYNYLGTKPDVQRIPFEDAFFNNSSKLKDFVKQCDVIVHLAAMNRHGNPQVIYETNIKLVKLLINACEETGSKPHVIFSSSTQEQKENLYGQSKLDGRRLLEKWAARNTSKFSGLIIPNVFGPFGHPYYNSVIATFSHKLTHNEAPEIHVDASIKLIYVNQLIDIFYRFSTGQEKTSRYEVPHFFEYKVSEILKILQKFKESYFLNGTIPDLSDPFHLALFNTFRCYITNEYFPRKFAKHSDKRGDFVEIVRTMSGGQFSFSTTLPGITRGNHFHTRKVERFAIIKGKAVIKIRRIGTEEMIQYRLDGNDPAFVDIPIWHTHNLTNIGKNELVTLFWINEPYNPEDPDTFYEDV